MTFESSDQFDTMLSDGLHHRAATAGRPSRGFSDVRRRYRRRRQQQIAVGLVPAVAGLGWVITRPRTDAPLQPSGGGLVDCGDTTVPTWSDPTWPAVSTTSPIGDATSTTVTLDPEGSVVVPYTGPTAPPWTGGTTTTSIVDSAGNLTTTTLVPADFPVLFVNASQLSSASEWAASVYPGVRMTTATSTVRESVVLATEASLDRASTIARDLRIAYSSPSAPGVRLGLDTPLVPAGTDLSGIDVIVIIGDDLAPDQGLAVTTTTICVPTSDPPTADVSPTTSTGDSTTTTSILFGDFTSTKVQVANCSIQNGVARMLSTALGDAGFATVDAVNGLCDPKIDKSYVIYDESVPGAQAVAETVAIMLGGLTVEPAPLPIQTESGEWAEGSGVVVLLGNDLAGLTLDQITHPTTTIAQP